MKWTRESSSRTLSMWRVSLKIGKSAKVRRCLLYKNKKGKLASWIQGTRHNTGKSIFYRKILTVRMKSLQIDLKIKLVKIQVTLTKSPPLIFHKKWNITCRCLTGKDILFSPWIKLTKFQSRVSRRQWSTVSFSKVKFSIKSKMKIWKDCKNIWMMTSNQTILK